MKAPKKHRQLALEPLENRLALSSAGITSDPQTYSGGLEDKIVYIHAGHGFTSLGGGSWGYQRPETFEMVEDLGNHDQMSMLAEYLLRSGATVVPLRPVGNQTSEFVLDNDDVEVTFTGAWNNSSAGLYFGSPGDVPYRFAATSATETATARYQPNFTESGFYPVYSWTRYGADRAADHLYRVHHAGGETEVTINHRRVGNGLVYLGTYYFDAAEGGYVEISNRSSEAGRVVIADMIRFGNGVGDIDNGSGISGKKREDEAGLYWVQWHVDRSQGILPSEYRASSNDQSATVTLAPRYSEYMNRELDGSLSDRLFVSYHSNAANTVARGVIALHNTANGGATPNQFFLAETLAEEINDDLVAQNGEFEHNWSDRGSNLTFQASFNYGEINNAFINSEFDATIVETGFHDNQLDAEMLRDARVRDAIARATYQGIIKYFRGVDGNTTIATTAPAKVDGVWATPNGEGSITVGWDTPPASVVLGDAATSYRIQASTDGYGFDGGTLVAGGSTTTHTFTGLDPTKQYYFRVVAVNEGGESPASQVVAATATDTARSLLIVNGFDRLTRALNPKEPLGFGSNTIDRVRPRQSNAGDYVVPVADSIGRVNPQITVASASNEAVIAGDVVLGDYDVVIWMSGEESTEDETFSPAEQTLVTSYVLAGGDLFASGAEIAWDLDAQNNGQTFFNNIFDAEYQADDANTYLASGVPGEMFAGISLEFDDGDKFYNVEFADVLTPGDNATSVMQYATGGAAGIFTPGLLGRGDVLLFGFPIESILDTADLDTVLSATLDEFAPSTEPEYTYDEAVDDFDPGPAFEKTSGWTLSVGGGSFDGTYLFGSAGGSSTATWQFDVEGYGQAQVLAWWVDGGNRADSVTYSVETAFGTTDLTADQTTSGGQWVSLGFVPVAAGITEVTLDAANATGGSLVVADAVRLVISNGQPASADFNDDLIVDVADFTLWRDQLGAAVTPGTGADATGDGLVSVADYQVWKDQFGTVITPPAMPLASVAPAPPAIKIEEQESRFAGPVDQSLQGQPAALRSASVASFTGPVSTRGQAPFNAYFASEEPFAVRSQAIESANLQLYFDSSFSPDAFRETTETSLEVELQAAAEDPSRAEPPTTLERDFDLAFEAFK